MSKISVIGIGYVGLVTAACFADLGHQVVCVDTDKSKIKALTQGKVPIFEAGLEEILEKTKSNITYTCDLREAFEASNIIFIAVGTPQSKNGSANMKYYNQVIDDIAEHICRYTVIVNKSTVPIGTADIVKAKITSHLQKSNKELAFDVVSNPEFLRQGTGIHDFMHPDRIIIGTDSPQAHAVMNEVYQPFIKQGFEFIYCNNRTAEIIKYAANAFLAVKVSFINEISALCDAIGSDVVGVAHGIGTDPRIGNSFLQAGPGYGGSCFPKDTEALCYTAKANDIQLSIISSAIQANNRQKKRMCEKISKALGGNVAGKTIGILGLAFKKNTDDMRSSPALTIVTYLKKHGAVIKAFDPAAMSNAKINYFSKMDIIYAEDPYSAAERTDALVILTDWDSFKNMDLQLLMTKMEGNIFIDLRNLYERNEIQAAGFLYYGVGR